MSKWAIKILRKVEDQTFCFFINNEVPKNIDDSAMYEIGFGFHQIVNTKLNGAVDFKLDNDDKTILRVGCDYMIDDERRLKSRILLKRQEELRLGFVYKQKLSSYTNLTFSVDLNTRKLISNDATNDHRFWLTLKFGD